jgi:hypothetical protein
MPMPVTITLVQVQRRVQLLPRISLLDCSQVCMELVLVTPLTMVEPWPRHLSAHPVHMVDTVLPLHKLLLPAKLETDPLAVTVDAVETPVAIQPVTACLVVRDLVQVQMVAAQLVAQLPAVASVECLLVMAMVTVMVETVLVAVVAAILAAIVVVTVLAWVMVLVATPAWVMAMVPVTQVWVPNWLACSTRDLRSSGSRVLVDLFP